MDLCRIKLRRTSRLGSCECVVLYRGLSSIRWPSESCSTDRGGSNGHRQSIIVGRRARRRWWPATHILALIETSLSSLCATRAWSVTRALDLSGLGHVKQDSSQSQRGFVRRSYLARIAGSCNLGNVTARAPRALTHFSPICVLGHSLALQWSTDRRTVCSARHRIGSQPMIGFESLCCCSGCV